MRQKMKMSRFVLSEKVKKKEKEKEILNRMRKAWHSERKVDGPSGA
jgi:hypothetical protein